MSDHINQVLGHGLMVSAYLAPPVLYTVVGRLKAHDDPFSAWAITTAVYVVGHLISAGVIK